ncbi:ankyrin repeat domain-containing protein [Wolbachia pipientis]|uniref:ankyrin repeat domain-containing protein n=1 Tax=Wolbachia pipientis TaxID=955 RepID=UPI002873D8F3|nr:ankyrin repeat domain-containing protein [Wolbachia pipientis]
MDDSNNNGYTPLHIAAQKRLDNIVQLLLKHGANVDATTKEGYTPLHVAAQKAHNKRVVQLLLDGGAGVNVKDNKDYTPLHDAAQSGSKDVVQLLLGHGADINAQDENYVTPLLLALEYSYAEVFDLLIADPNINVGGAEYMPPNRKSKRDCEKYDIKYKQDKNLFEEVKKAANEKDTSKRDELLKEVEKLLKQENKYGFKLSLNYSPNVSGKGATVEVAIKAGGKLLQLLYDYAEKNIGTDTEIFKQLKQAKENSQPKSDVSNVSVSGNLIQAQGFKLGGA